MKTTILISNFESKRSDNPLKYMVMINYYDGKGLVSISCDEVEIDDNGDITMYLLDNLVGSIDAGRYDELNDFREA